MLRRTEKAIARRVASLLKQARQSIEAQLPDEAEGLLAAARNLDPQADGLREAATSLARARAAVAGPLSELWMASTPMVRPTSMLPESPRKMLAGG